MYMMERQTKDQEPEKVRKRKALQDDLVSAKKRRTDQEILEKEVPKQEEKIKQIEEKLKLLS